MPKAEGWHRPQLGTRVHLFANPANDQQVPAAMRPLHTLAAALAVYVAPSSVAAKAKARPAGCQEVEGKSFAPLLELASAKDAEPFSLFDVACMHLDGVDTERDDAAAARWFLRAAERGHVLAQHALALLHDQGRGVDDDDYEEEDEDNQQASPSVKWCAQARVCPRLAAPRRPLDQQQLIAAPCRHIGGPARQRARS